MKPDNILPSLQPLHHNIKSRRLTQCYICGSPSKGEPREHTIPRSLGGDSTLLDGCCKKCHHLTSASEHKVFRQNETLRLIRYFLGLPDGKREKKSSSEVLKVIRSLKSQFRFFSLPEMPLPELLSMGMRNKGAYKQVLFRFNVFHKSCDIISPSYHSATNLVTPAMLAPVLAKVAHSSAVLCFGKNRFKPFLLSQIKNPNTVVSTFIGGAKEGLCTQENFICERNSGNGMSISFHKWEMDDHLSLILAEMKIFPKFPTPKYLAVVGSVSN